MEPEPELEPSANEKGVLQEDCEPEIFYAISSFTAEEDNQLDLAEGDEVKVIEKVNDTWWWVELNAGCPGYVPASHLVAEDGDRLYKQVTDAWQDEEYFASYGALKIQLEMLSDRPRTMAYKTAIENAKAFIKDKVVLDLGCGTGILSLFCAKIGEARKVYAVEGSNITEHTSKVVQQNNMEGIVEVIRSKGEDLELEEKVDLIISEWMGTLLLFELMVESVILTRDKVLKSDGVMWPSEADLYLVPCSAEECYKEKVLFWEDVYGFDFSPLIPVAQSDIFGRPIYNHVLNKDDLLSDPSTIMKLNLKTLQVNDLEVNESCFKFSVKKSGTLHGFGSWFEVKFGSIPVECKYETVTLSTSPSSPLTHWKQDLFMMDAPLRVEPGDKVEGKITITRNKIWRRHIRVLISFTRTTQECTSKEYRKEFLLWR